MENPQLPVDLLRWILALLPIVVLLVFMVLLRWTAPQAGPMGMFTAAAMALVAFATPWETVAVASAKGVWDAIFILYVVWPALLLYQVTDQAGGYDALRQGITRFSRNDLFIVIALGWVFSSFLQGIAGFGTPIAIVAPLLVAFGLRPVYAVVIPLIAHLWAKFFGTLGVSWFATLAVVDLADPAATAFQSGLSARRLHRGVDVRSLAGDPPRLTAGADHCRPPGRRPGPVRARQSGPLHIRRRHGGRRSVSGRGRVAPGDSLGHPDRAAHLSHHDFVVCISGRRQLTDDEAHAPDRRKRLDTRSAGAHRRRPRKRTTGRMGSGSRCRSGRDGDVTRHAVGRQRTGVSGITAETEAPHDRPSQLLLSMLLPCWMLSA
jgi:hypothetical protein